VINDPVKEQDQRPYESDKKHVGDEDQEGP
jgi:hypothetical protein